MPGRISLAFRIMRARFAAVSEQGEDIIGAQHDHERVYGKRFPEDAGKRGAAKEVSGEDGMFEGRAAPVRSVFKNFRLRDERARHCGKSVGRGYPSAFRTISPDV